jgi:hypothetical protein
MIYVKEFLDNMKQPATILVLQYWYPVFSSIADTGKFWKILEY